MGVKWKGNHKIEMLVLIKSWSALSGFVWRHYNYYLGILVPLSDNACLELNFTINSILDVR